MRWEMVWAGRVVGLACRKFATLIETPLQVGLLGRPGWVPRRQVDGPWRIIFDIAKLCSGGL